MTAITAVTTPATRRDDLTDADYRDIYEELRDHLSLAEFVATLELYRLPFLVVAVRGGREAS